MYSRVAGNDKTIGAYEQVLEKAESSLAALMESAFTVPGAAVMYHTLEFSDPLDLQAKCQHRKNDDPRRQYVTPLDTNTPVRYPPPSPATYEAEFTHGISITFLVDDKGAVHVRPFDPRAAITTLELSTITGTTFLVPL